MIKKDVLSFVGHVVMPIAFLMEKLKSVTSVKMGVYLMINVQAIIVHLSKVTSVCSKSQTNCPSNMQGKFFL